MAKLPQNVRKLNNGLYEKRFTLNNKRYSVYAKTIKELQEKEYKKRQDILEKGYIKNDNITLNKYFKEFIENKTRYVKENTIYTYKSIYNKYIKDSLGKKKIKEIEKREIEKLQKDLLKQNKSITTVNYTIMVISQILNSAIADDIIIKNNAKLVKNIKNTSKKANETIHRALTEREQELFMNELKTSNNYYYEFFAFLISSGLRFGECAALSWSDVDYKNNVIHINKTITQNASGQKVVGEPKTRTSKRDIPLTSNLKDILKAQKEKATMTNVINITNNVFTSIYGKVIVNQTINKEIDKTIQALNDKGYKINKITCHALRDTFATRFIEQGGTPQTLKSILGHTSLQMTMDLYAQVLPNTKEKEMSNINIVI